MMEQHGLEQVVADLKARGIDAGEAAAAQIIAEAKARAESILADARTQAAALTEQAAAEKRRTLAALEAELAQACRVGLTAFREAVEASFLVPAVDEALAAVITRASFLETAIIEMVRGFVASGMRQSDIEVVLPAARQAELAGAFVQRLLDRGAKGVQVRFADNLEFGFRIGPAGGGFSFDLSDAGFREILVRFVSAKFRSAFFRASGDVAQA